MDTDLPEELNAARDRKYGFNQIAVGEVKRYPCQLAEEAEKIRAAALKHASRHGKVFKTRYWIGSLEVLRTE